MVTLRTLFATLVVVLGVVMPAMAQPKPALVQDRDEPGRNPYQESVASADTGGGSFFSLAFPAVPAGHRLVVTHVSAQIFNASPTPVSPDPPQLKRPDGQRHFLAGFQMSGNGVSSLIYTSSSPVTFFVEAGGAPMVEVNANALLTSPAFLTVLMSGYLVALP